MKIGFLCFHPGSVNTVNKVIKELKKDKECELYYYPFIEYALKEWGIEGHKVYEENEDFFEILNKDLDVLIYSPAAGSFIENEIPNFCKKYGIVSVGTIDIFWLKEEEIKRRFPITPDIIITPEVSIEKMIESFKWDCKVYNLGNPHLEVERVYDGKFKTHNKVLNYISFPNSNALKCDTDNLSKEIIRELVEIVEKDDSVEKMYISTHPREMEDFALLISRKCEKIFLNPFPNTDEACKYSDIVIGYDSTVLYEQMLKGKPVIFYKSKTRTRDFLASEIENEINFEIPKNSSESICKLIKSLKRQRN